MAAPAKKRKSTQRVTESIEELDVLIGKRIRFRRNLLGISQEALGNAVGISFQQIQKYETGKNKVSAARLYHIAKALDIPILSLYEEEKPARKPDGMSDQGQAMLVMDDYLNKTETTHLLRAYYEIDDKKRRKTILEMVKAITP